jgi:tetratricopeptide (TPR) repeat protein/tRNA A-37 threonylcarbamoyl transferase component Bud32
MDRDILSSAPLPPKPGDELLERGGTLGRYVIIGLLGRGGMGNVYAAYDPELDRKVAVKLVRTNRDRRVDPSEARARLLREAQAIAKLSHPNVVVVYDVGTFDDSVFIAMEFIDGSTVAFWREVATRSWREILDVFIAAGRGLSAAHHAGMIHRDFKPENVMVTKTGDVRVMDFGLARLSSMTGETPPGGRLSWSARAAAASAGFDPESTIPLGPPPLESDNSFASAHSLDSKLTEAGVMLGTPAYMSPEQFSGKASDARADQFSFCVALYESLYGHRPFAGKTIPELITSVSTGALSPAPPDSRVPAWLRRVLVRGLQIDPAARYPSMDELLEALSHDPGVARRRALLAAGGAVAITALVAVGVLGWRASHGGAALCSTGTHKLDGLWEGAAAGETPRKRAIELAFASTGVSYATPTFARVRQILDRYVDGWALMYKDTCEATHVRGEQSASVLDLRMSCLTERLGRVQALTDLFAKATPTTVENAVTAAGAIPGLYRCADIKVLRSVTPVPEDPKVRARIATLQSEVAHVKALGDSGQCAAAAAAGRRLTDEARVVGYLPLEAESLNTLGRSGSACMSTDEAILAHRRAILAATASHDEEAAAEGMILLAHFQADRTSDIAQARNWIDLAQATLKGMNGNHPVLESWYLQALARIYSKEGKPEQSLETFRRAQALMEQTGGTDQPDVANVIDNMGLVLAEMNRREEALDYFHRAQRLDTQILGPQHPSLALFLANEAEVLNALGRHRDARDLLERALQIWVHAGSSPFYRAWALTMLGDALLGLGQPREAQARLEEALRVSPAGSLAYLPATQFTLARALWSLGQRERAIELARLAEDGAASTTTAPHAAEIANWLRQRDAD